MTLVLDGRVRSKQNFRFEQTDTDGTDADFETNQAVTDTPTQYFTDIVKPGTLKEGVIKQIRVKIDNANNQNITQLTLYADAQADNVQTVAEKIWDSTEEEAAGLTDGTEYLFEVDRHFTLKTAGRMFYQTTYAGAPGNAPGTLVVEGDVIA